MNIVKEKILHEVTPVSNQLDFPTCLPNALCDGMEYVNGDGVNLSRLFVFWNSEKGSTGGSNMSSALDVTKNIGVSPESLWPYSKENLDKKPTDEAFKRAGDIKGKFHLVLSKNEIIESIDANNPIIVGMICPQFFNILPGPEASYVFKSSLIPDESLRHAMLVVGYRIFDNGECHFRLRNSWGSEWMDGGYCWFESDYVISNTADCWSILSAPPGESILSKRNLEIILGISLLSVLIIFGAIRGPILSAFIAGFVTAFLCWRRFYVNLSVLDEANLFKLISSYRNSTGSPVKLFRGIINYFLR